MFAASRWMTCRTFPRRLLRLPRCCLPPLPGLKSTFPWSLGQACSAKRRSQWKTTRPCRWSHLVCTSIGPGLFSHRTMCQPVIWENVELIWAKKVILGTKFKRCVQHHELRASDCYFLGGFVRSNLSKPCAILNITFLIPCGQFLRKWMTKSALNLN